MNHDHAHPHGPHEHPHPHDHGPHGRVLTIRSHSGLSGDMLLTGLALMNAAAEADEAAIGTAALVEALSLIHI